MNERLFFQCEDLFVLIFEVVDLQEVSCELNEKYDGTWIRTRAADHQPSWYPSMCRRPLSHTTVITNPGSSYLYSTHILGFSHIDLDPCLVLCPTYHCNYVTMFRRVLIFHSPHTCTVIILRQLIGTIKKLTIHISFKSLIQLSFLSL